MNLELLIREYKFSPTCYGYTYADIYNIVWVGDKVTFDITEYTICGNKTTQYEESYTEMLIDYLQNN